MERTRSRGHFKTPVRGEGSRNSCRFRPGWEKKVQFAPEVPEVFRYTSMY